VRACVFEVAGLESALGGHGTYIVCKKGSRF
jgi:hypothetical protein